MKYLILALLFLSLCPAVLAHFTYNIVSNTMLLYLYDDVLVKELKVLDAHYAEHIDNFNAQEAKQIEHTLNLTLAKLNTPPPTLKEQEKELNTNIQHYNNLVQQHNHLLSQKKALTQQIKEETKTAIQENQHQIELVRSLINDLIDQINQDSEKLIDLERQEQTTRLFYHNQSYLLKKPLQDQLANLNSWITNINQTLNTKTKAYNQAVSDFKTNQQKQNTLIQEERSHIEQQKQNLETSKKEINTLVNTYNQKRETPCLTTQCETDLKNQQAIIQQKKEEHESQVLSFNNRLSLFNQSVHNNTRQNEQELSRLNKEKQELEQFKSAVLIEREQKNQAYEENIAKAQSIAQKEWDKAKEQLNQWQTKLTTEYGNDFRLFAQLLADWANAEPHTSLDTQALLESQNLLATKKQALCNYTQAYLFNVAQTICSHITNWHTLRQTAIVLHSQGIDTELKTALKQVEGQIQSLQTQVNTLSAQNTAQTNKLNTLTKQYNDQLPLREEQYTNLKTNLENTQDIKSQFIVQAYLMRVDLLNWEYTLIKSYMEPASSEVQGKMLSFFNESLNKFILLLSGQGEHKLKGYCFAETHKDTINNPLLVKASANEEAQASANEEAQASANEEAQDNNSSFKKEEHCKHYISGFPKKFRVPYRLINVLYLEALYNSPWEPTHLISAKEDLTSQLNQDVNQTSFRGREKQDLVLSWRHTPFISDFLNTKSNQITKLLQSTKEAFDKADKVSAVFIPYLFTQSFYQNIPFRKNTLNDITHYEVIIDDKPLWFVLEEGKLEVPPVSGEDTG